MNLISLLLFTIFGTASVSIIMALLRAQKLLTAPGKFVLPKDASDLPTVSVCIPARNEAHALSACLDRVLASDYEKLEILVLDDQSIDKTPTLIKSFAHAGVRFIAGKPLPAGWIGKNHALDTLAREASGDYIVYLDVDVHIATNTISKIVATFRTSNSDMLSFIPDRQDTYRLNALFGHMRYLWDLLNVGFGGRSASASLWCVRRDWLLDQLQGFTNATNDIRPELSIARITSRQSLQLGGRGYDISYEKHWHSQVESSARLIVPTIREYGVRGAITTMLIILIAVLPVLLISAENIFVLLAIFLVGYTAHFTYLRIVWRKLAWLGAVVWPLLYIQELCLVLLSFVRYATKTVTWKGRSIHASPENNDYYSV